MATVIQGNAVNEGEMPYRFQVKVCGTTVTPDSVHRKPLENGDLIMVYKDKSYEVPRVTYNPKKFLLMGDSGLRIKPTNLGLGKLNSKNLPDGPDCTAPEIYGVHQCYTNFTESDLTQSQTGDYQGLDEWYFKQMADSAAKEDIDLIVYVGDYLYRQGPCPLNNTDGADCSAVNLPSFTSDPMTKGTVLNFVPGMYGDNWHGWWADFFYPALNLLKTAPIIPTRGNHEICKRGGYGYFLFLSPMPLRDLCKDYMPPYAVKFEHEQFVVVDDSAIDPLGGGVDHYLPSQCPGPPSSGTLVPMQEARDMNDEETVKQLQIFTETFKYVDAYALHYDTNFYVGHRPILGVGCNASQLASLDWTLQQSLGPNTLDGFNALITGHMQ
ncbi:hypothetical protein ACHAWF_004252 [Thalassiosira exigua]